MHVDEPAKNMEIPGYNISKTHFSPFQASQRDVTAIFTGEIPYSNHGWTFVRITPDFLIKNRNIIKFIKTTLFQVDSLFNFRKYLKKLIIIKFCLFLSDSNIDLSLAKLNLTAKN